MFFLMKKEVLCSYAIEHLNIWNYFKPQKRINKHSILSLGHNIYKRVSGLSYVCSAKTGVAIGVGSLPCSISWGCFSLYGNL